MISKYHHTHFFPLSSEILPPKKKEKVPEVEKVQLPTSTPNRFSNRKNQSSLAGWLHPVWEEDNRKRKYTHNETITSSQGVNKEKLPPTATSL